jgi:chromosome segregation ATPase
MFIRGKIINVVGLVLVSLAVQGTFAFAGEEVYVTEEPIDLKAIRDTEERGINFAKKAIKLADPYPGMKTEVSMRGKELDNLVERKNSLTIAIQRLQIGLRKKKAEFARNPELLKVSAKQYTQKIKEMEDELLEVEKQIPALESELANVKIELQVEEIGRNIMVDEDDTGDFDEEFEKAKQERFDAGKKLLNIGSLSTPRFR